MMHDLPEGQTQYDKNEALAQSRAEGASSMDGLGGLPTPRPAYCCVARLLPCKCGADVWRDSEDEYGGLSDGGSYERFSCGHCGNVIYVQLPD